MAEETHESKKHLNRNAALIAIALLGANAFFTSQLNALFPRIPPELFHYAQAAGLILHFAGRIMDTTVTYRLFKEVKNSKNKGTHQPYKESSPILPETPTARDLFHPRVLLVDVLEGLLTSSVPFWGVIRFIASSRAAYVNNASRKNVLENMKNPLR